MKARQQILRYVVTVTTPLTWDDKQNEAVIENVSNFNVSERLDKYTKNMLSGFGLDIDDQSLQVDVIED